MTVRPIVHVGHPVLREADPRGLARRARGPGDPDAHRRPDRHDAARRRGRAGRQPGGRVRSASPRSRSTDNPRYPYKPPIPLTVVVNPGSKRSTTSWSRSTRAACRCPTCAARVDRHVTVRVRYLDRHGVAHDEVKRGLTAGTFQHECDHLDGRLFLDRVADPTTFTTWEQFERFHRDAFVERITRVRGAGRVLTVAGAPAFHCELAWLGGETAEADVLIERRRRPHRRGHGGRAAAPRRRPAAGARRCPGSPTPTATPSTGPCAAGRSVAAARSGPGASRCTGWRASLDPDGYHRLARAVVRRDGAGGHHLRRRVPLPPPRPGRRAVRGPERDGRGAGRRGGRRRDPHHAARHVLPPRRHRRRRPKGCSGGSATATPTRGPSAPTRRRARVARPPASGPPSTRCGPSTPPASRSWPGGRRSARAPRPRARVRAAGRERRVPRRTTAAPRRRCWPTRGLLSDRLHRRARHPRDRRRRRPARRTPQRRPACAPRPSATSPTASARRPGSPRRGRRCRSAPTPTRVIDPFEETRAVELDERLVSHRRGNLGAAALLRAATADGHRSLGWPEAGALRRRRARRPGHGAARLGRAPRAPTPTHAARRRGVRRDRRPTSTTSSSAGRRIVAGGAHRTLDVAGELAAAVRDSLVDARRDSDGHRPHRAAGHQRPRRSARDRSASSATRRVVVEADRVVAVDVRPARPATTGSTPPGAASSPASSTATRTSCSPATAATSSPPAWPAHPYEAGGIRVTVEATRAAGDAALTAAVAARADEALRSGHHDRRDQVGLRAHRRRTSGAACRSPRR